MRILQILHDFLPHHVAGVEVYTDGLARKLGETHDVALLFTEVAHEAPNYSVRRRNHGGLPVFEIVNNHRYRRFTETYRNPQVDQRVLEIVDEFRPQVVHLQHLINLSTQFVGDIRRRGIPLVMTLHDHWLVCANGGQRFHRDLGRCDALEPARCGACTAHFHGFGLVARGFVHRHLYDRLARRREAELSLVSREPTRIETPDPAFVYRDNYALCGVPRPTWVAHPPASLFFRVKAPRYAMFESAVAMHASTFGETGGAVRFSVLANGEPAVEHLLDSKRLKADREPFVLRAPLPEGAVEIELRSESVPRNDNAHCTGGWIDPRVTVPAPRESLATGSAVQTLKGAVRTVARASHAVQARRIEARWSGMKRMAEEIDLFLAPSRYLGDELVRFGLPKERVLHCDYGFPVESFSRQRDLPERARRFAFIGSLVLHKGVHVLLEAFRGMPADASLEICGSPDYAPDYSASLRNLCDHPGVCFVGGLTPKQVPEFLSGLDCLVVPSVWQENSPLTIHEAFLAGVPVIASRMGGHVELLAGGGGLLYDAEDAADLGAQLRRLYHEPGLGARLAATAPPVKSMDDHADELADFYSDLIRART